VTSLAQLALALGLSIAAMVIADGCNHLNHAKARAIEAGIPAQQQRSK
jgi:hypothetical protein